MEKTIKPFPLEAKEGQQILNMPFGAQILSVAVTRNTILLFARVRLSAEVREEQRKIELYKSGSPVNEHELAFIGTAMVPNMDGDEIFHIFENR